MIDPQKYIGRPFDEGNQNCFTLARNVYAEEYSIDIPNYACPKGLGQHRDFKLFEPLLKDYGFELLPEDPTQWYEGAVLFMGLQSPYGVFNHCAVLLNGGRILHHLTDRFSEVDSLRGFWRRNTAGVYVHPDVPKPETVQMELLDVLALQ
jgi:cell wall-associated NlpC family hydrolase